MEAARTAGVVEARVVAPELALAQAQAKAKGLHNKEKAMAMPMGMPMAPTTVHLPQ